MTTNTFGANTGHSVTASRTAGGATGQAAYGNTAANTKYLATSATNDAGNQSLYSFDGAGNTMTTTDAMAATRTGPPPPPPHRGTGRTKPPTATMLTIS
ncbi:hypothetical protein [Arthrobacter sp. A5]|uniref:hypothetical protein n=1 Tax=Arthrobacter sp. A5 TaxID=576926 RepID=UPI003DA96C7C